MPAELTAWPGGGVFIAQKLGKHIRPDWFQRFKKEGWDWHPTLRTFTFKDPELRPETEEKARRFLEEYNNRFTDAA